MLAVAKCSRELESSFRPGLVPLVDSRSLYEVSAISFNNFAHLERPAGELDVVHQMGKTCVVQNFVERYFHGPRVSLGGESLWA